MAIQSHYDHPGWYVLWRYHVDRTKTMRPGSEVVIWRVDVVFLQKGNWKYEGSKAGSGSGGRTYTFGVSNPSKVLRGCGAYALPNVILRGGKPVLEAAR